MSAMTINNMIEAVRLKISYGNFDVYGKYDEQQLKYIIFSVAQLNIC